MAEANQAVILNENEPYRVSHPFEGGDACLSIAASTAILLELAPEHYLLTKDRAAFNRSRLRVDTHSAAIWRDAGPTAPGEIPARGIVTVWPRRGKRLGEQSELSPVREADAPIGLRKLNRPCRRCGHVRSLDRNIHPMHAAQGPCGVLDLRVGVRADMDCC